MWKALKYILLYFAFQLVTTLVVMIPGLILKCDKSVLVILALALSSILFCWYLVRKGVVRLDKISFAVPHWSVLLASVVALCFFFLPEIALTEALSLPDFMEDEWEGIVSSILGLIVIGILVPITEEMLFRGAVLRSLQDWDKLRSKPWLAILLSGVFFALFHLNPAQMPSAFLMGWFLGWLCYRTGSLIPGMVVHVFNNSVVCIASMFPEEEGSAETLAEMFGSPLKEYLVVGISAILCAMVVVWLIRKVKERYHVETMLQEPEEVSVSEDVIGQ